MDDNNYNEAKHHKTNNSEEKRIFLLEATKILWRRFGIVNTDIEWDAGT